MSDPLEKVREIFLSPDIDEETRLDNEAKLLEWQMGLIRNEAYQDWKDSDITKEISLKAKNAYKQASLLLAFSRALTDRERFALWAEQDAMKLILNLANENAKGAIDAIHREIETALNATN
jgi:mannose/cellobiose epimerase-like protein (N-acyl-D-glucosamine 2-epimerase family)